MDVEEFYTNFMDVIETQLKGIQYSGLPDNCFTGKLFQEVVGIDCTHVTTKVDSFLTLALPVKHMNTLDRCLDHFTHWDVLEGDNMFFCDDCNAKVRAKKRISIHTLPNILTISLKRFEFDMTH